MLRPGLHPLPLVEENINRLYPQLKLVDPAEQMARTVGRYLEEKGLVNDQPGQGRLDIFTTGSTEEYTMKAAKVGLDPVTSVQFYPHEAVKFDGRDMVS